jgi:hypothetical protein
MVVQAFCAGIFVVTLAGRVTGRKAVDWRLKKHLNNFSPYFLRSRASLARLFFWRERGV